MKKKLGSNSNEKFEFNYKKRKDKVSNKERIPLDSIRLIRITPWVNKNMEESY